MVIWVQENLSSLSHDFSQFFLLVNCGLSFGPLVFKHFSALLLLNFRAKVHSTRMHSHNSEVWGWKYGYRGTFSLLLMISLNFFFWLTVSQSFKLMYFFAFSCISAYFDFSFHKAPLAFICYIL